MVAVATELWIVMGVVVALMLSPGCVPGIVLWYGIFALHDRWRRR